MPALHSYKPPSGAVCEVNGTPKLECSTTWLASGVAPSKNGPQNFSGGHASAFLDTGLPERDARRIIGRRDQRRVHAGLQVADERGLFRGFFGETRLLGALVFLQGWNAPNGCSTPCVSSSLKNRYSCPAFRLPLTAPVCGEARSTEDQPPPGPRVDSTCWALEYPAKARFGRGARQIGHRVPRRPRPG